ncbi:polyprenyl synthetase family protein [Actinocatenispora sera]|uniref:Geranylgeranyl pyrophosphate synthase n=1 Tax=Actinocatenispora sera TaxID=390989 RepID=A0A810KU88_9ACTN|nr:polyprenyl synthetase family protein [Actinocatenispora sera]BCJ26225.1 geranylgeranyl pyrophosphate synthase [Actinocatenispora sera]
MAAHPGARSGATRSRAAGPGATGASAAGIAARVDAVLDEFVTAEIATLRSLSPEVAAAAAPLRELILGGGKRLRPAFGYWGYRGVATGADEAVLRAVSALELLHAFALIHDDVMDAAATRRGAPTLHRQFGERHVAAGWRGDPARFGDSVAVLLGDLCTVWADRLIGTSGVPAAVLLGARREYDEMRIEAVAGQYLDVLHGADGAPGVGTAVQVARFKSASYTVQRPLQFGAALSGAVPPDVVAAYDRFGGAVGEAFQLRDDLLGVYGESAVTGKPVGADLRQGKPTVLAELAFSLAAPAQHRRLDRVYGDPDASDAAIADAAAAITESGARAEAETMISARVSAGLAALAAAPIDPVARDRLSALALACVQRLA